MRSRDADLLFIPDLAGADGDHWQSRWQAKLPGGRRIDPPTAPPYRADWVAAIRSAIGACERPAVAIAHGMGVPALLHALSQGAGPLAGAFLAAPPGPSAILSANEAEFLPYPDRPLPCRALVVASRTDSRADHAEIAALAAAWGARFVDAGEAGRLDSASGHGPWPEGLMTFAGFLSRL